MLFINLQDKHQLAGPTPKHLVGASGTPRSKVKLRSSNLLTQNLKVAHQKVNLDVDLACKTIRGYTEMTIMPTSNTLRSIKLDARQMKIKDVFVNGSNDINYHYQDMLYINDPKIFDDCISNKAVNVFDLYSDEFTIHQHHLIKDKLSYLFRELHYDPQFPPERPHMGNTEELTIFLPENLKLEVADFNSFNTPTSLGAAAGLTPIHMRGKSTMGEVYTPIQIGIYYEVVNPKEGVNFACNSADKLLWHAYTVNSEYNVSASSWVPSIDNLWEKSTFSVEMAVPRSINHIASQKKITQIPSAPNGHVDEGIPEVSNNDSENSRSPEEKVEEDASAEISNGNAKDEEADEDEEAESLDLFVCTGDSVNTKEMPHQTDITKKLVSWSIFNPVCAHHLGWAVGAFQSTELTDFSDETQKAPDEENINEEYEELEKDDLGTSVTLYYLPGQEELAKNTCIFAKSALAFFLSEFGSYPFSSYGIVFVNGPAHHYNNFSGLSVLSDKILYPADVIEPMFTVTENILECIAGQWSGINIVPQTFNDLWCTRGIAGFMSFQFMRELMGQNEFRFNIKRKMGQIVEEDVGKHPISMPYLRLPVSEGELDFVRLKSSVVLFILDRRMTKTDKLFGLSRVLPKIFLQAMSGDLQNGTLSTLHFQYVCEKVNRNRLDNFFKQWVYGTGTPIFSITQRFNKKRSLIEVVIRQIQHQTHKKIRPKPLTFVDDSLAYLNEEAIPPPLHAFLGPMTIRVHEADGTPYEHIVDIKDSLVKFDVQYNTKSRRMRKKDENLENNLVFSRLGDILQTPKDLKEWNFEEWPKRDEDFSDPYEWIRVDTDFEWIARVNVRQPDYMFGSQLQQDRDVEAQFEAIRFFSLQEKPLNVYCTALTRTLLDSRYYYGIRIAAAKALADMSRPSLKFIGLDYLLKAFRKLFCFDKSNIPVANSFDDFGIFFLQKSFPKILGGIRDDDGKVPKRIKEFLLNLVRYNDNSNNDFQDCFYVKELLEALTQAVIPETQEKKIIDFHVEKEVSLDYGTEDHEFVSQVTRELDRLFKIDEWMPSYRNVVSVTCLEQKVKLARNNLTEFHFQELMFYTSPKYYMDVRIAAFEGLLVLGGLKNAHILGYFAEVLLLEASSAYFKLQMVNALKRAICEAAINGTPSFLDDPEFQSLEKMFDESKGMSNPNNMIVIEESQNTEMNSRRDALARASIKGAIQILRRDYGIGKGIQKTFWNMIHSSLLGLRERKLIFILCEILFREEDIYPVHIAVPYVPLDELKKKIVAKDLGDGSVVIKREGRFRIQLSAKILFSDHKKQERAKAEERAKLTSERQSKSRTATTALDVEPSVEKPPEKKIKLKLGRSTSETGRRRLSLTDTRPQKEQAKSSLVTRDTNNGMNLRIKFSKHKLKSLPEIKEVTPKVDIKDTLVTIKLRSSRALRRIAQAEVKKEPAVSVKPSKPPQRYVKISTRTGSVSLSATPFPEARETQKKRARSGDARPIKREESDAVESATSAPKPVVAPKISLRNSQPVVEQKEAANSRAASPFSPEPSPGPKKKKNKIYIHGNNKSQSNSSKSSELPALAGDGKDRQSDESRVESIDNKEGGSHETQTSNGDKNGGTQKETTNGGEGTTKERSEVKKEDEGSVAEKPKLKLKLNLK